jgi:hypothetical protein
MRKAYAGFRNEPHRRRARQAAVVTRRSLVRSMDRRAIDRVLVRQKEHRLLKSVGKDQTA